MTITIDCRMLFSSGVGVYLRECLPYFLDSDNDFFLMGDETALSGYASGRKNAVVLPCSRKPFSFLEIFFFPRKLRKTINGSQLYYSPFFNIPGGIRIPVYTTIHDTVFPDMPELTSRIGLAARMYFYRRAFAKSRKIFTVSEFSKSRIKHYSRNKIPVIVTYNAIQPWILEYAEKNGPEQKEKTILFIGNIKKHKGLDCLLQALSMLRGERPCRLIIIGNKDNFRSSDNSFLRGIGALGSDAASFTGFVNNERLAGCIRSSALLVQPSLYEGFGLPPLEAMALGTRALVSDIPVFKEIYGDFPVVFFRAGDPLDLKNKLVELLDRNEPFILPEKLLVKYTFEKTASVILRELSA